MESFEVLIVGAGAAGLMCAIEAGKKGRSVLVLDSAKKPEQKIRISGGGRCNFTNLHAGPENYLSQNPYFCISALKQYTQFDFIELVKKHGIKYHEKTLGQLFCDGSAQEIIDMLLRECAENGVEVRCDSKVQKVSQNEKFTIELEEGIIEARSLVIASGGLSIPKMGASSFGYDVAKQFGLKIVKRNAALVPFLLEETLLNKTKKLSGISVNALVKFGKVEFEEGILFTHKGLSGPAILQISSYWKEGEEVVINMLPRINVFEELKKIKQENPKKDISSFLAQFLPKKLVLFILEELQVFGTFADLSHKKLENVGKFINEWKTRPIGTEGYRTAEVTIGGVDTDEIDSKTFEAKKIEGLYFIGEVLDVTGHLGGFNFQWAWSSGFVCGKSL